MSRRPAAKGSHERRAATGDSDPAVTGAIRQAARLTGADFEYLLATAQVESNLNPNAQAATSSARGLFQFIEQTWLDTMKERAGARLRPICRRHHADSRPGDYVVTDPRMRQQIMALRNDPDRQCR